MKIKSTHLAAFAALAVTAAPAVAQNTSDPAATTTYPVQQEEDDDFPWGLLGLLGLAGLMGLKRRDDDHRRTSGTGTNNR